MRLVTAICLVLLSGPLGAQASFTGIVRDSAGKPIPEAGVLLLPGGRNARTDQAGRFRIESVPAGAYSLQFRRLGFLPAEMPLLLATDTDTTFSVVLRHRSRLLDTVVTTARGCSRVYFDGFLCRRQTTPGLFLTEADLLAMNPHHVADIFLDIKGFHVSAVQTPTGPSRVVQPEQSRCIVQLIDGRPPIVTGTLEGPSRLEGAYGRDYTGLDFIRPRDLIGVEIYHAGSAIPEEYAGRVVADGNRCVLVNYWTTASLRDPNRTGLWGWLKRIF